MCVVENSAFCQSVAEAEAPGFEVGGGIEFSGPMDDVCRGTRWNVPVTAASIEECRARTRITYDVIVSWGVMTILRDPLAVMAEFNAAFGPGWVLGLNTYNNLFSLGPDVRAVAVYPRAQHQPDPAPFNAAPTRRRGRLRPGSCLTRATCPRGASNCIVFVLLITSSRGVRETFFERVHFLNRVIPPDAGTGDGVRIRLCEVMTSERQRLKSAPRHRRSRRAARSSSPLLFNHVSASTTGTKRSPSTREVSTSIPAAATARSTTRSSVKR